MIAHAGHRLTLEAIVAPRVSVRNEDQRHSRKRPARSLTGPTQCTRPGRRTDSRHLSQDS